MPTHTTGSPPTKRPTAKRLARQANTLLAQFMSAEDDGSLAQRVREVVACNHRKAVKARKPST